METVSNNRVKMNYGVKIVDPWACAKPSGGHLDIVGEVDDIDKFGYGCSVNGQCALPCINCYKTGKSSMNCAAMHYGCILGCASMAMCCIPIMFSICYNSINHDNRVDMITETAIQQLGRETGGHYIVATSEGKQYIIHSGRRYRPVIWKHDKWMEAKIPTTDNRILFIPIR